MPAYDMDKRTHKLKSRCRECLKANIAQSKKTSKQRPEYKKARRDRAKIRYATDEEYREKNYKRQKAYREKNREKVNAANQQWVIINREHVRKYQREYAKAQRKLKSSVALKCNETRKIWRHNQWNHTIKGDFRHKSNQEISKEYLRYLYAWQGNRCYICNTDMGNKGGTIEHIIPKSLGGPTIERNIAITCKTCNFSRQDKLLWAEWEPEHITRLESFLIAPEKVLSILNKGGLPGKIDDSGGVYLEGRTPRKVFVISTFACSERDPLKIYKDVVCDLVKSESNPIVLFDHELYGKTSNTLNLLRSKLGLAQGLGARKLNPEFISAPQSRKFLNEFHLMGFGIGTDYIGLWDSNGTLWAVGAFKKCENWYDCTRLAFRGHVPGGMSRIMKFLRTSKGTTDIFTYIDSRYATGEGHEVVGFKSMGKTPKSPYWVMPNEMKHYRFLNTVGKQQRNLLYHNASYSIDKNAAVCGIYRLWIPPRYRIIWEDSENKSY